MSDSTVSCDPLDIFCHLSWLTEEIRLVFVGLYHDILSAISSSFSEITPPDFFNNVGSIVSNISADVWYFAQVFEIPYGATVVFSAVTIRFLIRRLPIIG